jgi:hypothetical protein
MSISCIRAAASRLAARVAEGLRDRGIDVLFHCGGGSFKSQMKKADASGAGFAVIIGDDEAGAGEVTLKPLRATGEQAERTEAGQRRCCRRRNHELYFGLGRIVMATYDLEEQEQIAEIKAWWKQYGNLVVGIVTAVSIGVIAWQGWNWYQRGQAAQASMVYGVLQKAVADNDSQRIKTASGELLEKFGGTAMRRWRR